MDLALAKAVEAKLPSGRLDAAQFGALVQACRAAKEALLADNPPPTYPVTVMGRGRAVVGGTVSVNISPDDVKATIFDGFFPAVPFDAEPGRGARAGLQEMGLPYVSDPAVSKHLAAFLRQHLSGEAGADTPGEPGTVDAILFNGGVFQPRVLQERVIEVMGPWFKHGRKKWHPLVLTSPSLDLAVAWGAAYFAWLRHSGGKRIGGGIPRSYYVHIETGDSDAARGGAIPVLCVVPRRLQEGEEVKLPEPELELAIGQPVLFPLYTSTVRGDDKPGDVLRLPPESLLQLPPLHTVLRGGKRAGAKRVPVTLAAKCTEIGTLELYCVSKEGNRWRLEFNVRDVIQASRVGDDADSSASRASDDAGSAPVVDVFPEERVQLAGGLIAATFRTAVSAAEAVATPPVTPQELPKLLETVLESPRGDWPTGLIRRLWDFLEEHADGRGKSPAHLARWYNLVGFCLRPGFGDPVDRYRVESLWKLITTAASGATATAGPKKPTVPEGGADYWIMWRRVSGGLNTALQQALFSRLRPALLPAKGKQFSRPPANEYAETWRAAASLERLDAKTKEHLGAALVRQCKKSPVPVYAFWSLTRLGTRVQFYGPLNTVVHPEIVGGWLDELIAFAPGNDSERNGWLFCLAELARRSGLRAVDVSDYHRERALSVLRSHPCPPAWPRMVEEVVATGAEDQSRLFGESLPIGLRLAQGAG
jgi:hypothetical protein